MAETTVIDEVPNEVLSTRSFDVVKFATAVLDDDVTFTKTPSPVDEDDEEEAV
jgi:hypothetical protein